ncbi:ABC transporter permease (plasmid) [Lactiplantibacillus plantarum subsp. plantarum]|uniref:ABC transporter permease n=1 Tax=Lactiplantibacillus plantarum TaxID=1590 RepID=UPI000CD36E6B|nr:ABC transporter permease [Lactiplantibacillus plantarum]AUV74133.1 ABC transporter permease [Lactiplantibacillus plantarum subsp. plantarum]
MLALIKRNIKVFVRDRMAFFLSLLSVLILLILYKVFLGQIQIDGIKAAMDVNNAPSDVVTMVNYWLVAGLVTITSMSATLGAYGVSVDDRQHHRVDDFMLTLISPIKIEISYMVAAVLIGSLITFMLYVISIVVLIGGTGLLIGLTATLKVMLLIIASSTLSLLIVYPIMYLIKTNSQFASFSTIIGTAIGFLTGVYISIGSVSASIKNVITWFPLTPINSVIKQLIMEDSLNKVFKNAPNQIRTSYEINYGILLRFPDGTHFTNITILEYMGILTVVLIALGVVITKLVKVNGRS